MVFSRRKALRRIAFTSPLRRTDARFTVSYTAAWSAMPSRKSWLNPSWRIRRASTSSLPFRRVPMTWSSQVWLRNTLKTKACTRCLSADGSAVREHSRSTRVSAKERPACQLLRQFSAVWRGEGGLFFTGELYMRNVQVSTCKNARRKKGVAGPVPDFTCLFWGCPLPSCKWPGVFQLVSPCFRKIMSFFRVLAYLKEERFILFCVSFQPSPVMTV